MIKMEKYESIKAKLLKMQALAEKGCQGEAKAAKAMIEILCRKYGLAIEDILSEQVETRRYEFVIGKGKIYKTLFTHCHGKVMNKREMSYYQYSPSKIALDLTPLQFAELSSLYEWHKDNFKKDLEQTMDTMVEAYINKHNLFSSDNHGTHEKELTNEDIKKITAMLVMMEQLSDNSYHKMIEQK